MPFTCGLTWSTVNGAPSIHPSIYRITTWCESIQSGLTWTRLRHCCIASLFFSAGRQAYMGSTSGGAEGYRGTLGMQKHTACLVGLVGGPGTTHNRYQWGSTLVEARRRTTRQSYGPPSWQHRTTNQGDLELVVVPSSLPHPSLTPSLSLPYPSLIPLGRSECTGESIAQT